MARFAAGVEAEEKAEKMAEAEAAELEAKAEEESAAGGMGGGTGGAGSFKKEERMGQQKGAIGIPQTETHTLNYVYSWYM